MTKRLNNKKSGFTLIEIMVAVSIFVIVAFIVTSTLLVILDASRRANKIRLIVDNINFSLDSMSFKIKFGKNYTLLNDGTFSFFDRDYHPVSYCQESLGLDQGAIIKCQSDCTGCSFPTCDVNNDVCHSITTPEVNVTNLKFHKTTCGGTDCLNEEYVMFVKAQTMDKSRIINLEFQTAVSQSQ